MVKLPPKGSTDKPEKSSKRPASGKTDGAKKASSTNKFAKDSRPSKEARISKDSRAAKDPHAVKDPRSEKDSRSAKGPRSAKDSRETQGRTSNRPRKTAAAAPEDATESLIPVAGEKVQKVLARAGLGSRREMERAIEAGSVKVNDRIATLGDRVNPEDKIFLNGHRVLTRTAVVRRRVILYNKPEGEICSRSDPEGRRTVYDSLPPLKGERWISVGRLDFNTSGLLLFTNDGEMANKLMHPSSVIDREYLVRIQGEVDDEMKGRLLKGVLLDDGIARFTDIVDGAGESRNRWFYCVVMEGRNREVRRLWESQGVKVSRLKRVRYGNIFIPSHVRVGQWLELGDREIHDLCLTAGLDTSEFAATSTPTRDELAKAERHEKRLRAANMSRRPPVKPRRKTDV